MILIRRCNICAHQLLQFIAFELRIPYHPQTSETEISPSFYPVDKKSVVPLIINEILIEARNLYTPQVLSSFVITHYNTAIAKSYAIPFCDRFSVSLLKLTNASPLHKTVKFEFLVKCGQQYILTVHLHFIINITIRKAFLCPFLYFPNSIQSNHNNNPLNNRQ